MKAITVQQPWAWAIVHGGKTTENRSQLFTYRGPLAIHAGARWSDRGGQSLDVRIAWRDWCRENQGSYVGRRALDKDSLPIHFGAIIGVAQLVDVHIAAGCCPPWGEERYVEHGGKIRRSIVHLTLEDIRPVIPVPCRGALGLWTVPDDIAAGLR